MSKNKVLIIRILITLLLTGLLYYFFLPPINITSMDFWVFLLYIVGIFYITSFLNVVNITEIFTSRKTFSSRIIKHIFI